MPASLEDSTGLPEWVCSLQDEASASGKHNLSFLRGTQHLVAAEESCTDIGQFCVFTSFVNVVLL